MWIASERADRSRIRVFALLATLALCSCRGSHSAQRDGGAAPRDPGDAGEAGTPLVVADAGPPADDTMPRGASEELTTRAKHLLEAIAKDDAQLATDIEFPRDGWLLTRDAADPGKEWQRAVARPFRSAVHALSRRHKDLDRAELVSIEVGRAVSQVSTKKHGWKSPLWTVHESHITFVVGGRTRTLSIREMTAWRGAWYITRLR